jgi:hypothetical protein
MQAHWSKSLLIAAFALQGGLGACGQDEPVPGAPRPPGIDAGQPAGAGAGGASASGGTGAGGAGASGGQGGAGPGPIAPAVDAARDGAPAVPDVASAAPAGCAVDAQRIFADVAHLASRELRGRKPGDPGNELSVQYAERQFTAAGLAPSGDLGSFRQAFEFRPGAVAHNVLGVLRGTDPALSREVIVVGAHIDHLGVNPDGRINHGADDNASGAAIVMELARMFGLCGLRPKRTVLFVEFNAEEMGLIGSRHYVANPVFPLAQTIAMYNFDMVGAGDSSGVLLFGGTDSRNAWLTELMRGAATAAGLSHVIQTVPQKLASDHAPFVGKGIPICWGFARPDPHPGYHTPDDDITNVRPASLKAVGELFWAALRPLAMGEEGRFTRRPPPAAAVPPDNDVTATLPFLAQPCSHGGP